MGRNLKLNNKELDSANVAYYFENTPIEKQLKEVPIDNFQDLIKQLWGDLDEE